jgi:hypothetical protein
MSPRLSKPQAELLAEIKATERGVLYIDRYGRYARTIEALARRGLVHIVEPDRSPHGQDGWAACEPPAAS